MAASPSPLHVHDLRCVESAESLPLAPMRDLFDVWCRARDQVGRDVPALEDLDRDRLEGLSERLLLLEPVADGTDYHYLHHGREIALHFGRDMSGRRLSELPDSTYRHYRNVIGRLAEERTPLFCRVDAATVVAVEYWDRLILPLANGDRLDNVLMLNVARAWRVAPERYFELAQNLNHMEQGLLILDAQGIVTEWNRALLEMFDVDLSRLRDRMPFNELRRAMRPPLSLPIEPRPPPHRHFPSIEVTHDAVATGRIEQTTDNGRWLHVSAERVSGGGVAITVTDLTELKSVETALRHAHDELEQTVLARTRELEETVQALRSQTERQRQLRVQLGREKMRSEVTLMALSDAVLTTDEHGAIDLINPSAEDITGFTQGEARGQPVNDVLRLCDARSGEARSDQVARCVRSGTSVKGDRNTVLISRAGARHDVFERVSPIPGEAGDVIGAVIIISDITRERAEERRIAHAASHDALTGLRNRIELDRAMTGAFAQHREHGTDCALLFIDLDNFKPINDVEGHATGDRFLRRIADTLTARLRRDDCVFRYGGDEFALLLDQCGFDEAVRAAQSIRREILGCELRGQSGLYHGSASIGIALVTRERIANEALIERADNACYAAKRAGGNQIFYWDDKMQEARGA